MSEERSPYRQPHYYSPDVPGKGSKAVMPPKKAHKARKLFLLLLLLVIVVGGGYALFGSSKLGDSTKHDLSSVIKKTTDSSSSSSSSSAAITTMGSTINSTIAANSGIDISVNLINLNNGQREHYGVNQTFQAASTAKILTAAYFLHEVQAGQQSLSETVGGYTAQYELQQMIVVSDDTAWANLNNLLGYNNLQSYADTTLGINDYQAYNNSLSSRDIALALEQLWQGKLLNPANTQIVLGYMKQANYRQYIVPAIPSEDTIYHKIGLYEDYVNDAAIVTHGKQAFVIVIFTNGNGAYNWPARATMMQGIAKAALKVYFNQS